MIFIFPFRGGTTRIYYDDSQSGSGSMSTHLTVKGTTVTVSPWFNNQTVVGRLNGRNLVIPIQTPTES
ncbi:MAG: hypothetical protein C7B47_12330 [Sulfobacillus thermosulfidooxidans]|uniref:Uncharacterized protein n=1 Tax=Sulfobacillus thermosulfidooxidans TaxID=28034 RepID=A0A2T2WT63_SULTH|nr:MAG: hypothetical protein C7B47_12330 [Sulfobacillus thermosulfidooxidans]